MSLKRIAILIIILGTYLHFAANNPPDWFKLIGYNQILDLYGSLTARYAPVELIYDPGLREIDALPTASVKAVIPGENQACGKIIAAELDRPPRALIECSALDSWHTTPAGQISLTQLRSTTYRVVVFDGGHHLATLGLEPDILLVPSLKGIAAHGYMRDGLEVKQLQAIVEELQIPTVIAVVPRWALVKRPVCLELLTQRILDKARKKNSFETGFFTPRAARGISYYHGTVLAYVSQKQMQDLVGYAALVKAAAPDLKEVYLAVDFNQTDPGQAQKWARSLSVELGDPVTIVNLPVKTSDLMLGR